MNCQKKNLEIKKQRQRDRQDHVVKSLRNWARAQASKAERRGRFQGSQEVGVAVVEKDEDVVLLPAVASATVITSSI